MEEEKYSPYCDKCGSCGESGCCDPLMCIFKYREFFKGKYCESNFADVEAEVKSFREIYEHIMNKEGISISIEQLKEEIDFIYEKNINGL